MTDEQRGGAAPVPGVLGALRDGWHSLGGGDAASCPGCPVCRLGESAGRLDPATTEHLQQAAGHLLSAGRELLAALQAAGPTSDQTSDQTSAPTEDRTSDGTAAGPSYPTAPGAPAPRRTRIPVDHDPTSPQHGNEEHP